MVPVAGYITAVPGHTGRVPAFDVNGKHVIVSPQSGFGLISSKKLQIDSTMAGAIEVGA